MSATDDAMALLSGLVMPDGSRWGDRAVRVQLDDAAAVLDVAGPRRHWIGRSRGFDKTSGTAGTALVALLTQLVAGATAYCAAADVDQAGLVMNAITGYLRRTPELAGAVTVRQDRVVSERTGAQLQVISSDAASAYGLIPAILLIDELCQWKSTPNAREFYTALTTALPKVPDSRLVIMSTAGDPSHWSRKIYDHARKSDLWRVSETHGPAPWQDPVEIAEQEAALLPSQFRRLFYNEWTASEDQLVDPADLDAACVLRGRQPFRSGRRYVIAVDLGLKKDRTAIAVAHRERVSPADETDHRVVVDLVERWSGTRSQPVELGAVEARLVELSGEYGKAQIIADPWQSVGLLQRLRARGVRAEERAFSTQFVGRLAHGLYSLLKNRRIHLPAGDEMLRDELSAVRIRETQPGQYRMDHSNSGHDDQAIATAMAAVELGLQPARGPSLVLDSDDGRVPAVPEEQLMHQAGVFAFNRGDLRVGGPGEGDPDEVDARVIGGQPSPYVSGPVDPVVDGLPSGGQRSPFLAGGGDVA